MTLRAFLLAGLSLPVLTGAAAAHHSFAMFDRDRTETIIGVVKEFEWTNPHAWLHVVAPDKSGKMVEWSVEMQPINQDILAGWHPDSVKPGDKVSVDFHPLKDGSRGGQLVMAILPDGKKLRDRAQAPTLAN